MNVIIETDGWAEHSPSNKQTDKTDTVNLSLNTLCSDSNNYQYQLANHTQHNAFNISFVRSVLSGFRMAGTRKPKKTKYRILFREKNETIWEEREKTEPAEWMFPLFLSLSSILCLTLLFIIAHFVTLAVVLCPGPARHERLPIRLPGINNNDM